MTEDNICNSCGSDLQYATFLSEDFDYDGGTMVFRCECGEEIRRTFIPTDIMPVEESMKYIMIQQGVDKEIVQSAMNDYKVKQNLKKIGDMKIK